MLKAEARTRAAMIRCGFDVKTAKRLAPMVDELLRRGWTYNDFKALCDRLASGTVDG
jgi:hypothetical protein